MDPAVPISHFFVYRLNFVEESSFCIIMTTWLSIMLLGLFLLAKWSLSSVSVLCLLYLKVQANKDSSTANQSSNPKIEDVGSRKWFQCES